MGHSKVTKIQLDQDGKTLYILVHIEDFEAGAPVEISGHAVQTNGAAATFHKVEKMPPGAGPINADFTLTVTAAPTEAFGVDRRIVAVANATECWFTAMKKDSGPPPPGIMGVWVADAYGYPNVSP
jgi:hypothetical protein